MNTSELANYLHKNFGLIEGTYVYVQNDDGTITVWQCPVPYSDEGLHLNSNIDFESKILEDIEKSFDKGNELCSVLMKSTIDVARRQILSVEMAQKNNIYESVRRECHGNTHGISVRCGNGDKYYISVEKMIN